MYSFSVDFSDFHRLNFILLGFSSKLAGNIVFTSVKLDQVGNGKCALNITKLVAHLIIFAADNSKLVVVGLIYNQLAIKIIEKNLSA